MPLSSDEDLLLEKDLFLRALEIEGDEEQKAFLDRECGGNPELRAGVEHLLGILDRDRNVLDEAHYENFESERNSLYMDLAEEGDFLSELGVRIRTIDEFELLEEVGRGAMGLVFRARQTTLKREVALKIVLHAVLRTDADRSRFRFEAESAARLSHPNIVPVYQVGKYGEHDYYAMEFVTGGTLRRVIKEKALSPKEAVRLFLGVVAAVEAAHERGLLHRDLKPDNILMREDGRPMVSDFGLACGLDQGAGLTLTGQLMGTPRYMAPELIDGEQSASVRSDLYSLGAILFELLAGRPAFEGDSVLNTLRKISDEAVPALRTVRDDVDRDLDTIVRKCLEKDPDKRYPGVRGLRDDLEAWLDHRPITARPPSARERMAMWVRRHPTSAAVIAATTLLVLLLGIGGPTVAYQQASLRRTAESAENRAEHARGEAVRAAEEAREQAAENQRLAYSANLRYTQLAHEMGGPSVLAAEALVRWGSDLLVGEDLRGWEWYYNYGRILEEEKSFRIDAPVHSLAISPDGTSVAAAGGASGTVIRNTLSAAMVRELTSDSGHKKILWSSDGTYLYTLSEDGRLDRWTEKNGRRTSLLEGEGRFQDFSVVNDVLVTLDSSEMRVWRLRDGEGPTMMSRTAGGAEGLASIALSPDGSLIAGGGDSRELLVWAVDNLEEEPASYTGASGAIVKVVWRPGGRMVAASIASGEVRTWGVPGGERSARVGFPKADSVSDLAWNPSGDQLAILTPPNRRMQVLDFVVGGNPSSTNFKTPPLALAWNARSHTVAVGGSSGRVQLLRRGLPPTEVELIPGRGPMEHLKWSNAGNVILGIENGERFVRIDPVGGVVDERMLEEPVSGPVAIASDGNRLAFVSGEHLKIVSVGEERVVSVSAKDLVSLHWSDQGFLLAGTAQGEIMMWNSKGESQDLSLPQPESREGCVYERFMVSPRDRLVVGEASPTRLTVWDLEKSSIIIDTGPIDPLMKLRLAGWNPAAAEFLTVNGQGGLSVWNLLDDTGEPALRFGLHNGPPDAVAWHRTGSRLATVGRNNSILIWDRVSGERLLTLRPAIGKVRELCWDPSGRRLVVVGEGDKIKMFDATSGLLADEE